MKMREGDNTNPQLEKELEKILVLKRQLDTARPLPPSALAKLKEYFNVEWTYNSNAIEGNSLSLAETKLVILDGITIGGKSVREHLEAINHKKAIDHLENIVRREIHITEEIILFLHQLVLREINDEEAGKYRSVPVYISGSRHRPPDPATVPLNMRDFVEKFHQRESSTHPVLLAADAHDGVSSIHPFVDGNGRVSRLIMNFVLLRAGYPPTIVPVGRRSEYIEALETADTKQDLNPFYIFVAECVEYALAHYLRAVG